MSINKFVHQTDNFQTKVDSNLERKQGSKIFYNGEELFSLQPIMEEKQTPKSPFSNKKILDKDILVLSFGDLRKGDFFPLLTEKTKREFARHPELLSELLEHSSGIASKVNKSLVVAPEIPAVFFQPIINFVSSGKNVYPMTYEKAKKLHDISGKIDIRPIDLSLTKYFHYSYVSNYNSLGAMLHGPHDEYSKTLINNIYRNVIVPDCDNINVDYSNLLRLINNNSNFFITGGGYDSTFLDNAYRTLFVLNKDNELSLNLSNITLSNIPPKMKLTYCSRKSYYENLKENKIKFPKMGENNSNDFFINLDESPSNGLYKNVNTDRIISDEEDLIRMIRGGFKTTIDNEHLNRTLFMSVINEMVKKNYENKTDNEIKELFLEGVRKRIDVNKLNNNLYQYLDDEYYLNEYVNFLNRVSSIIKTKKEKGMKSHFHYLSSNINVVNDIEKINNALKKEKDLTLCF